MSPDAQRIAIAEACGWNHVHYARDLSESVGADCFRGQPPGRRDYYDNVPDYLNDLNAMHEAAKSLDAFQWEIYREELAEACTPLSQCHSKEQQFKFAMEATAAQRAEAFLRTIGKWPTDEN